jgi:flagellar protein FliS
MRSSIKKYTNVNVENVADATPHQLISIIFKHILANVAVAKGAISRKEIENKSKSLGKSIALIGELQDSIDMENGGEISQMLFDLYQYILSCISEANLNNDIDKLDEVIALIIPIKEGWDGIPEEQRQTV